MNIFRYIPLMGILLALYNLVSRRIGSSSTFSWDNDYLTMGLPTGAEVTLSYSEGFIALGLIVLFVEVVKSTSVSNFGIIEQILSVLVFVIFLVQFLNSKVAAEPTFFLLTIMSLIDVLAGFVIMTKVARRDISFGGG
jgi:hypothetical protein